ncbi:DUF3310 domain-containing protein [Streptomyces typhae]|uniref:DUF3310 domain-containing protein n=1 Tax=Streptomyces typhae TaxID=2681492 RepID=UPI0018DF665F
MTYEIGDRVIISAPSTSYVTKFAGKHGTVTSVGCGEEYEYEVTLEIGTPLLFAAYELERAADGVNDPSHYTWLPDGLEVIDIAELLSFSLGNVVKYVLRAGRKTDDPLTDLRKAAWYINREINRLETTA